jgi:hypothetical protein
VSTRQRSTDLPTIEKARIRLPPRPGEPMTTTLGDALQAFILEHEYCGELDAAVEDDRVWMMCTCGAVLNRRLE